MQRIFKDRLSMLWVGLGFTLLIPQTAMGAPPLPLSDHVTPSGVAPIPEDAPKLVLGPGGRISRNYTVAELNDLEQIRLLMSTYLRAVDQRDGHKVASLFSDDFVAELLWNDTGVLRKMGDLRTHQELVDVVETYIGPYKPGEWSHHFASDPVIELNGKTANISYQLIYITSQSPSTPEGSAPGTYISGGSTTVSSSGYYQSEVKKINGIWLFGHHRGILDIPNSVIPLRKTQ